MNQLDILRESLGQCDEILLDALLMRNRIVEDIMVYKEANDIPILQPEQEKKQEDNLKQKLGDNVFEEEILNIFKDESKTELMKVEDSRETKVYEKYITFTSLTEYPGAIYEVCVAQEGRTVEELITDAMDQITQTQLALCEIYEMMP